MIGSQTLFGITDQMAPTFRSHYHTLGRLIHRLHVDHRGIAASRKQSGFIHQIGQISAGKPGSLFGDHIHIYIGRHGFPFSMHLQNGLSPAHIGTIYHDLPVKTAGTQ